MHTCTLPVKQTKVEKKTTEEHFLSHTCVMQVLDGHHCHKLLSVLVIRRLKHPFKQTASNPGCSVIQHT